MNKNILIEAISYLDSELLENHFEYKEKMKANLRARKIYGFRKWASAIAVCFAVTFVIGTVIQYTIIGPHNSKYGYTAEFSLFNKGEQSKCEYGTIEYIDYDECSITIIFNKITNDYIYATLYGYSEDDASKENLVYCGTSLPKIKKKDVIRVDDGIQIYVDGIPVSEFPQNPGKYTIRIVYENLKKICDRLDIGIYIHGFDYFVVEPLTIEGVAPGNLIPNKDMPIETGAKGAMYVY